MSWAIEDKELLATPRLPPDRRWRRKCTATARAEVMMVCFAHALRSLALARRRFGYRRLHLVLRREGLLVNHKKLYRLYREEKLAVRKRGGRKRALGHASADRRCRRAATSVGASTSCRMLCAMAAGSVCLASSTTSRASAWRWSRTPRCRARGLPANSMR